MRIWLLLVCTLALAACTRNNTSGPTPTAEYQTVWPRLETVEPSPAIIGENLTVVGSGGYRQFETEGGIGYDESFRTFTLYLDDEEIGEIGCYVNRCEGEILIPRSFAPGDHELSVEGDSNLKINVIER